MKTNLLRLTTALLLCTTTVYAQFNPYFPVPFDGLTGQVLRKKSDTSFDLEWAEPMTVWGNIAGNITLQSDLQSALGAKADSSTLSGYVTNTTFTTTLGNYTTTSALGTALGNYTTTAALTTLLAGKEPTITASTTDKYWRGDKTWQTLATVGTTGAYADLSGKPTLATVASTGAYSDLTGKPTLATVATTGAYSDLTGKPTIPGNTSQLTNNSGFIDTAGARAAISLTTTGTSGNATYSAGVLNIPNYSAGGTVTSVALASSDFSISGSPVTGNGTITANLNTSGITAGTYSSATYNNKGIATAGFNRVFGNATLAAVNTVYQNSSGRDIFLSATVDIGATLTLTGGATGTVTMEYADNSGMSTNLKTVQSAVNGNTGTLTVGLSLTQTATASLTGIIPSGKYYRVSTANTAGTPSFTFRSAQEVGL